MLGMKTKAHANRSSGATRRREAIATPRQISVSPNLPVVRRLEWKYHTQVLAASATGEEVLEQGKVNHRQDNRTNQREDLGGNSEPPQRLVSHDVRGCNDRVIRFDQCVLREQAKRSRGPRKHPPLTTGKLTGARTRTEDLLITTYRQA
jgi:hypothetical protein